MFSINIYSQDTIKVEQKEIKTLTNFLDAVGQKESTGRYHIVSKSGYLGKYQFHTNTLKTIGVKSTKSEFLKSKTIQDDAMIKLMKKNKQLLQKEIDLYSGKVLRGLLITESGILAAAHLGGSESVKRFLNFGKEFKDGNGTKLSYYLVKFGGYFLNLE